MVVKGKPKISEAAMQRQVMLWLSLRFKGLPAFFWKASDKFAAGIPDIVGVYKGRMWCIELKVGKNTTTLLQDVTLTKLQASHVPVTVCYSKDEVKAFIEEVISEVDKHEGQWHESGLCHRWAPRISEREGSVRPDSALRSVQGRRVVRSGG